jgi:hypothetical protein
LKSEARNKDTRETKEALDKMRGKRKERTTKRQTEENKQTNKQTKKQKIALHNVLILIHATQDGPRLLTVCRVCCEDTSPVLHISGRAVLLSTEYF